MIFSPFALYPWSRTAADVQDELKLDVGEDFTPIWRIVSPLNIRLIRLTGLKLGKKLGMFASESVSVSARLYYGSTALSATVQAPWCRVTGPMIRSGLVAGAAVADGSTSAAGAVADVPIDNVLGMGIAMKNIPRAARIIFTVSLRSGPIAWAGCIISEVCVRAYVRVRACGCACVTVRSLQCLAVVLSHCEGFVPGWLGCAVQRIVSVGVHESRPVARRLRLSCGDDTGQQASRACGDTGAGV